MQIYSYKWTETPNWRVNIEIYLNNSHGNQNKNHYHNKFVKDAKIGQSVTFRIFQYKYTKLFSANSRMNLDSIPPRTDNNILGVVVENASRPGVGCVWFDAGTPGVMGLPSFYDGTTLVSCVSVQQKPLRLRLQGVKRNSIGRRGHQIYWTGAYLRTRSTLQTHGKNFLYVIVLKYFFNFYIKNVSIIWGLCLDSLIFELIKNNWFYSYFRNGKRTRCGIWFDMKIRIFITLKNIK